MTSRYLALLLCLTSPVVADETKATEALKQAGAAVEAGDFPKALEILKTASEDGNVEATFNLGEFHLNGKGVEVSIPKALEFFQAGADQDHTLSHFRLGEIYLRGAPGVEVDHDRGLFHLQSASEAGLAEASALLGNIYKTSAAAADAKPERDRLFKKAQGYLEKAAEENHPGSQLALAYLLESGDGGTIDAPRATELIKSAALNGNPEAMNELGLRHQAGKGVPKDPVTALGWFFAGAERGNPAAMTNLGTCYSRGIVLPTDQNKAGSWYAQASKLGYAPAQYFLGEAFEKGFGTQPNPAFAYVNYSRAAAGNHAKAAQALETLAPKLTPEQKEEAFRILSKEP